MLAADWTVLQVFWSLVWFTLFFLWIILLFRVFGDIFRSRDMSGIAKALWIVFVILFPYLGVLVYLIARGPKMAERDIEAAQAADAQMRAYIRETVGQTGGSSAVAELERLAALREKGVISEEEFQQLKAGIVS